MDERSHHLHHCSLSVNHGAVVNEKACFLLISGPILLLPGVELTTPFPQIEGKRTMQDHQENQLKSETVTVVRGHTLQVMRMMVMKSKMVMCMASKKQGDLRSEGYHSCRTTHSWGWRLTFGLKAGPKSLGGGIWNRGLRFKGSSEGLDLNMTATYVLPKLRRAFHVALASRLAPVDL
ncbi:hypothetical protein RHSIM_RhsimUnG0042100 [Rhododendron simsii]|uniref:Uncharacterized protein n=1 Tax=Rhododendron simsii TaxID=118357 RepID=A0A834FXE4_RHOSS|nr:hypothetical protein RHSIM_RhsimUnG0042100 [Rhododendron simsii]